MSSLLGLASYDSDHTDADDAPGGDEGKRSPTPEASADEEAGVGVAGEGVADLIDENSDSRLGESIADDGVGNRETQPENAKGSSGDAAAPPTKESRQFFMPLPSPLVRLDHSTANSPFHAHEPNDGLAESEPALGDGEGEGVEGEGDDEDRDIIRPEHRDMLPPEATGQANPQLQAKIAKFLDRIQGDFTKSIKSKKDYGNPAVLAQVSLVCACAHALILWW